MARVSEVARAQATFSATLVDEWVALGVRHAVVAPGSRSTPMALALAADDRLSLHVFHDERCASFAALGIGRATGVPAVLLCTSGSAATHFHGAVVEAHHGRVPMLVCTADRPPELRGVGAPQTIDQQRLYGTAAWFREAGDVPRQSWRDLAVEAFTAAAEPAHLNLPFREPLVSEPDDLPPRVRRTYLSPSDRYVLRSAGRRPLVVASRPVEVPDGIPVLADPRAGIPGSIRHADAILRAVRDLTPDLVVRIGSPPASRVVNEWLAATGAHEVCDLPGIDPYGTVDEVGTVDLTTLDPEPGWDDRWRALDAAAAAAVEDVLARHPEPNEPATARRVLDELPAGSHLVVASSMPIRDLEWFATPRADVTVHANRGTNGIDGTISTAVGVALGSGAATTVLLGDVAFLHDVGALVGLVDRAVDLRIVVIDNDGGGIFSFLPQASALPGDRFERLFGTPHGVDVAAVATGFGVDVEVVRTDRAANKALHDELNAAVAAAVSGR
jgi:2-succinyl-5-enolpyruvyl-6-hydroxy-3-cyclohexene-1-carboxylate synthase